jgi:dihydropyrimidinase
MLPRKGTLAPGADADVVVWNPDLSLTATHANRHSKTDYTPYEGMVFTGGPERVYLRGALAYCDGNVLAPPGSGAFVQRRLGWANSGAPPDADVPQPM